jgi:hypothetical protein
VVGPQVCSPRCIPRRGEPVGGLVWAGQGRTQPCPGPCQLRTAVHVRCPQGSRPLNLHDSGEAGPIKFRAFALHFAMRSSCLIHSEEAHVGCAPRTGLGAQGAPYIDLSFGALRCKAGLSSPGDAITLVKKPSRFWTVTAVCSGEVKVRLSDLSEGPSVFERFHHSLILNVVHGQDPTSEEA